MATSSNKRKKECAGGAAAADPPAEVSMEQAVEQAVQQDVEQVSDLEAVAGVGEDFAFALERVCDKTEAALDSLQKMRAELVSDMTKLGMLRDLAEKVVDKHQLDTQVQLTHVQSAATRLVQLMERLRIGPSEAEMYAREAGAAWEAGGVQSSVNETVVYNLHSALADAVLARATLVFERNKNVEKLEQRTETWRNRMTERLDNQRSELEAGFKQTEKTLRSELDKEKKKLERLRGSWCIFLLDAEQLVELQGELEEAMLRVKRQQDRRACESTLCEKIPEAVCPITKKIMLNPVLAADGHTYERPAIERLIALHKGETKLGICNYGGLIDTLFTDVEGVA
jgi:hypothetical protein